MFRTSLKPGDWLLLVFSAGLVLFLVFRSFGGAGSAALVRIEGSESSYVYPLDAEVELDVPGPLGLTHVHIHENQVWISDSPCTEKICIAAGEIHRRGDFVACLPNRVLVQIEGGIAESGTEDDGDIDVLAF